ncbi:MAG TPA: Gfo/Idh/MocA family oxidoreductase [Bauldia sp.]|nr:Gfo/Idh/MocA family oxidoreductase [Bauldia sp.]
MRQFTIGIIGVGKIVEDQHLPVIAGNRGFRLAAVASQRGARVKGAETFRTPAAMYAAFPDLDAVAVCTPPQVRHAFAREALAAGKHVLLEKPTTATLSELADLVAFAAAGKRVLFTTWHSQYNAAVDAAKAALAGEVVKRLTVTWKEDVRRWHPGQKWIWKAGGFGVFDPGINALSIVTKIMPDPVFVTHAELTFPSNCDAPIAARLAFSSPKPFDQMSAEFDWRQTGDQTWEIEITTDDHKLNLSRGGTILDVDGKRVKEAPSTEYEQIYEEFHDLLASGRSHIDATPLQLVADAFLIGRRVATEAFHE